MYRYVHNSRLFACTTVQLVHLVEHNHSQRAPLLLSQLNYSIDLQAYYLQQSMWVDNMYVRIAEVTSTSDMQFKMLMAFVENVLLPRNIEAGQLSGEIFKTSDNSCFVISRFSSKQEADKIMQIMRAEMEELRGNNRIRFLEGGVPSTFFGLPEKNLSSQRLKSSPSILL